MSTRFVVVSLLVAIPFVGLMLKSDMVAERRAKLSLKDTNVIEQTEPRRTQFVAEIKLPPIDTEVDMGALEKAVEESSDMRAVELLKELCTLNTRLRSVVSEADKRNAVWAAVQSAKEYKTITGEAFSKEKHCL